MLRGKEGTAGGLCTTMTWSRSRSGRLPSYSVEVVKNEQQLRAKLRKIIGVLEDDTVIAGERQNTAPAIERIRQPLNVAAHTQYLPETKFSLADQWQRRLLCGLCRRYGLEPYRYKGQSHATVMVQSSQSFVDDTLWPEYLELQASLHTYFNEAAERGIREEVIQEAGEAKERAG
jgi:hypothetical protein